MKKFFIALFATATLTLTLVSLMTGNAKATDKAPRELCSVSPSASEVIDKAGDAVVDLCEGYQTVPYGYCEP